MCKAGPLCEPSGVDGHASFFRPDESADSIFLLSDFGLPAFWVSLQGGVPVRLRFSVDE